MLYAELPTARASIEIAATPEQVWSLVSDVQLMVKLSEELQEVTWLDDATEPASGRQFSGRSFHPALGEWTSVSTITECEPGVRLVWDVDAGQGDEPSSQWGFEIEPTAAGTRLSQFGRMGPERSGLSYAIDRLPAKEAKIVANRLAEFQAGLESNLKAFKELAEGTAG